MPSRKQFKTKEEYNAWFREYREKRGEEYRKYQREYNRQWRKLNGYYNEANSQKRYPKKLAVKNMVRYAILAGKLKRKPCEVCGSREKIQAHHDNYDKPLSVRWLCPLHHKREHKKLFT